MAQLDATQTHPRSARHREIFLGRLTKVLIVEEMGGSTYSVQYTTDSKATLDRYYLEDATKLRSEAVKLFGDKMISFRTELELISDSFNNLQ
jgi:hypothetical protein